MERSAANKRRFRREIRGEIADLQGLEKGLMGLKGWVWGVGDLWVYGVTGLTIIQCKRGR